MHHAYILLVTFPNSIRRCSLEYARIFKFVTQDKSKKIGSSLSINSFSTILAAATLPVYMLFISWIVLIVVPTQISSVT